SSHLPLVGRVRRRRVTRCADGSRAAGTPAATTPRPRAPPHRPTPSRCGARRRAAGRAGAGRCRPPRRSRPRRPPRKEPEPRPDPSTSPLRGGARRVQPKGRSGVSPSNAQRSRADHRRRARPLRVHRTRRCRPLPEAASTRSPADNRHAGGQSMPSAPTLSGPTTVTLDDKYTARHGRVLISGIQAIVRMILEQRRLDTARGLNTRAFVSGYQGSPLAGLDQEMARARSFLDDAGVVFRPGLNEELAATAVAGTQLLRQAPGRRHDGVTGFWYGKNPGLDRAADAIRHGTLAGTAALGGAVALIGDDPSCKSSTVPSSCEPMAQSLLMPLLAPGSVAEVVELGLHAVAMSRASGLWTGLKIVADVADASATLDVDALNLGVPAPDRADDPTRTLVGAMALDAEHDALTRRLDLARSYARAAGLNRITFTAREARLGVLASGTSAATVQRALDDLGLDEAAMEALGLRIITLAMPFPIDADALAELTDGLDEVLVVED